MVKSQLLDMQGSDHPGRTARREVANMMKVTHTLHEQIDELTIILLTLFCYRTVISSARSIEYTSDGVSRQSHLSLVSRK
jgi:hypothetical protein